MNSDDQKQAFISLYAAARQVLKNCNPVTIKRLENAVDKVDRTVDQESQRETRKYYT